MSAQVYNSSFWDERYNLPEYIYGTEPNEFLKSILSGLPPGGSMLFPADGEGRNSVYAASLGWSVSATDWSSAAREKALQLAARKNVTLNYTVANILELNPDEKFDAVGLFFIHLIEEQREKFHALMLQKLKPGGLLVFEAFNRDQLGKSGGGPQNIDLLYSLEQITSDFIDLDFDVLKKETVTLAEGNYHKGEGVVIRFAGRKPLE